MIWDIFFLFIEQIAPTRAYITARISAYIAQEKWRLKFPKAFMLLNHNSTCLWLLEFCINSFVVICIYLDIAAFQDFEVFLLLPHADENFSRGPGDREFKNE